MFFNIGTAYNLGKFNLGTFFEYQKHAKPEYRRVPGTYYDTYISKYDRGNFTYYYSIGIKTGFIF